MARLAARLGALYDPLSGTDTEGWTVGFLGRLMAFVFLEKKARGKLARREKTLAGPASKAARPADAAGTSGAAKASPAGPAMTPEREKLIAKAMKLRQEKQSVLSNLSEQERRDMVAKLTGKGRGGDK